MDRVYWDDCIIQHILAELLQAALQIILDLCVTEKELAKTRSQI